MHNRTKTADLQPVIIFYFRLIGRLFPQLAD